MNIKKIILKVVIISTLEVIYFYIPKNIDVVHEGIEYKQNDTSYVKKINIKIKGKLQKSLFKEDKFVGSFEIDGHDYTKNYEYNLIDMSFFHKEKNKEWSMLSYTTIKNGLPEIEQLGPIYVEGNFKKVHIAVCERITEHIMESKNLTICAPAKNIEDAVKITEKFKDYRAKTGY